MRPCRCPGRPFLPANPPPPRLSADCLALNCRTHTGGWATGNALSLQTSPCREESVFTKVNPRLHQRPPRAQTL